MALEAALAEWRALLGDDAVLTGSAAQGRYGASAAAVSRVIPAALRLESVQDLVAVVRSAGGHGVSLYPISTGHNWGYGSANPVLDGCVVVDLSPMDRVVEFDADLGLVTLEPGVTQRALRTFLDTHGPDFLVPVHGGGPECSLVGNALERGYGITPYADHFGAVTSLEAVLPDGALYRSPLSELGGDLVDRAFKWGTGPYLDGIFTQGNFGIVTRMTIALARRPERIDAFFFGLASDADLEEVVERTRAALRSLGSMSGAINLLNARRVLSMMEPYPRDRVGPEGIVPDKVVIEMSRRSQILPWMGAGALYGPKRLLRAARTQLREELRPVAKRLFFASPRLVRGGGRAAAWLPGELGVRAQRYVGTLDKTLMVLGGEPSQIALPLAYWRGGNTPEADRPLDPARDGCGLIWYSPLIPMKPDRVRAYVRLVETVCTAHGIEPLITLTTLSDRCYDSTVPILFDRGDPREVETAHACYRALFEAGCGEGFVPYRSGVFSMPLMTRAESGYWRLVQRLKRAVDPGNVVAPGRYDGAAPGSC